MKECRIYFETSVIEPNLSQEPGEKSALQKIEGCVQSGALKMVSVTAKVTLRETETARDEKKRTSLKEGYDQLKSVTKDEKVLGFFEVRDQYGGFVCSPLVSDVQDESVLSELVHMGLTRMDAEHVTQAVCDKCDVFLTRDVKSIISKAGAQIEARFGIKVQKPSQFLSDLMASGVCT